MTHAANISERAKTVLQSNLSAKRRKHVESASSTSVITSIILGTPSPEPYIILDAMSNESSSTKDNLVTSQKQSTIRPPPAESFGVLNASTITPTTRLNFSSRSIPTESESSSNKSVTAKRHGKTKGLHSTRKMTLERNLSKLPQSQTNLNSGRPLHLTQSASMRPEQRRVEGESFLGLKMLNEEDDPAASSAIDFQMLDISGLVSLPLSVSGEESSDALSIYVPPSVLSLITSTYLLPAAKPVSLKCITPHTFTDMRHILKVESASRLTAEARYVREMDRRVAVDAQLSEERKIRAALEARLAKFTTGAPVSSTPDTAQSSSTEVELLVRMSNQRDTAPPELSASASPIHMHPEPDEPLLREELSALRSLLALSELHTAGEVTAPNNDFRFAQDQ
ncbi:hypothetical protein HETIRDRAFT_114484 [Heterobasidion irregulare TC 32-1]|uniref:Uncharacterized protein n=1 Tax=Heterobasidion irregulare (strain TC 32-1) TaxID=747525 RepID=W4KQK6_HETIT|nr:uncharacterized protein HETIRDRAFT_114484 [Heterobasidion irregulare TC 32-1]ETW87316.1 hypothetical protein HETIRDRAFT_114484 [Heterobasidion irregulare TC 32-1]